MFLEIKKIKYNTQPEQLEFINVGGINYCLIDSLSIDIKRVILDNIINLPISKQKRNITGDNISNKKVSKFLLLGQR